MSHYDAQFECPLGVIMLRATESALTGAWFTDQADCPRRPGMPAAEHPRPQDGELEGRPIRGLHARRQDAGQDLFGESPAPSICLKFEPADCSGLTLLGQGVPAGARAILQQAHDELLAYFAGERKTFSVPLDFEGSPFQQRVWRALQDIPYGEYVSYGDVAVAAGMTRYHGRPVGKAVGQNPVSIIVPCHRVLASSGKLNGYTGGLDRKVSLLRIEGFEVY